MIGISWCFASLLVRETSKFVSDFIQVLSQHLNFLWGVFNESMRVGAGILPGWPSKQFLFSTI